MAVTCVKIKIYFVCVRLPDRPDFQLAQFTFKIFRSNGAYIFLIVDRTYVNLYFGTSPFLELLKQHEIRLLLIDTD